MKKILFIAFTLVAVIGLMPVQQAVAGPEGKCKACHNFGEKNGMGPGLKGIVGRKAGTFPGYKFSDALKNADWVWDEEHLRKWMKDSKKAIREFTGNDKARTKMGKQNVKGKKADKIFEFLKTI